MLLSFIRAVSANLIQLADECSVSCPVAVQQPCPQQCVALNNMMSSTSGSNLPPLTTPEQEALRKTYDIAVDNQNLINNQGSYNSDGQPVSGNYYPDGTFNPDNSMPSGATGTNGSPENPFGPPSNNLVNPNSPSDNNDQSPGSNGLPLIPSVRPFNEPKMIPQNFNPQMPQPKILPVTPQPPKVIPVKIPTVTLKQTVLSYIPQLVTTTTTVQQLLVQDHTATVTQPPVYYQIAPKTVVQTLPRVTVTSTFPPVSITKTLPAQTMIQPVELPQKTVTSIQPPETVSLPPETMVLTEVIRCPPVTSTVVAPPVTISLPATTVYVMSTIQAPQRTVVYEKQKPVYYPVTTTKIVQRLVAIPQKQPEKIVPAVFAPVSVSVKPISVQPQRIILSGSGKSSNLPTSQLFSNGFPVGAPMIVKPKLSSYSSSTPFTQSSGTPLVFNTTGNQPRSNLNCQINSTPCVPAIQIPSSICINSPTAQGCGSNQFSKCINQNMIQCHNDMLSQTYVPPAPTAEEGCSLKNISLCTNDEEPPANNEKSSSQESDAPKTGDDNDNAENQSSKPPENSSSLTESQNENSIAGGILNKVSSLVSGKKNAEIDKAYSEKLAEDDEDVKVVYLSDVLKQNDSSNE